MMAPCAHNQKTKAHPSPRTANLDDNDIIGHADIVAAISPLVA